MKEILLVNPFSGMKRRDNIPVSILYLGSYLSEHGYKVKIFDEFSKSEEYIKQIEKHVKNATYNQADILLSTTRRKDFGLLPLQMFLIGMTKFRWSTNKFDSFFEHRIERSYIKLLNKFHLAK